MIDFNNTGPQLSLEEIEAHLQLQLEAFIDSWLVGLSQLYEQEEFYIPQHFKKDFLKMCAEEFDRCLQWGQHAH
jgi:hypothetical protein